MLKKGIKLLAAVLLTVFSTQSLLAEVSKSSVKGQYIDYEVDGTFYQGYLSKAASSRGLVLLIHDWDGLTDYEIKRAKMLAESGYDTFAIDLYGKGVRPQETGAKKAEMAKLYEDRAKMRHLILKGLSEARKLSSNEAIVMGYCFGGAAVLELARSGEAQDVKGYATFHGGLSTPEGQSYATGAGPFFISHGGADTSITLKDVAMLAQELEAVDATYDIEIYSGAPHAFTVFDSPNYQEKANKKSWSSFLNFLKDNLG